MPDFGDDIPEIDEGMLHREREEFETGMGFFPPVTLVLCVLCTLAYIGEVAIGALQNEDAIIAAGALNAAKVRAGEWWRLGSAMFLHGSVEHLLGNLIILYVLGMACEHGFGWNQFLVLYVFAGLVGSGFSLLGGRTSVGASGAVFGAAGGLIAFFARHHRSFRVRDARVAVVLVVWAGYQFALGLMSPFVDNLAHLGGLIGGFLIGLAMHRRLQGGTGGDPRRPVQAATFLAAVAVLLYTLANLGPCLMK